jgi:RHS repeat-associated protein
MVGKSRLKSPKISMPKGGGAIRGLGETFQPDAFSGTGSLSIPVYTSQGRGFNPQLSLDYNSGTGNGIFGIGFVLSIPSISRKTDKGIPKYDGSDTFIFSDADDLVPKLIKTGGGAWAGEEKLIEEGGLSWKVASYLPRIEGLFASIEHWSLDTGESFWQVVTEDNVTSTYGKSAQARISDPADPTRVFEWLIEETSDSKGNKVLFTYKQEDDANVPLEIYEHNRSRRANRYIQSIKYGNYFYEGEGGATEEQYAFEVLFDYGEYDLENPDGPPGVWKARPDSFSSYTAGFELRTHRLCRNILTFHRFTSEFGGSPFLVRVMRLRYDETRSISFLKSAQEVGYRREGNGGYEKQEMPALELGYLPFKPDKQRFKALTVDGHQSLPGYLDRSQYLPVDLYGEGVPGFLLSNGLVTYYWEPDGNGGYNRAESPAQFPIERDLQSNVLALMDLNGDGQAEMVVSSPPRGGYYQFDREGTSAYFQNFTSYPLDLSNPDAELADINGNGRADIVLFENDYLKIYPSQGAGGFGPPIMTPLGAGVPKANNYDAEVLEFADMFGDGLAHRVRIKDGIVECWPNLGYGRLGERVLLGNAPKFGAGFDAGRLFLADLDGSGTADMVYVYSDRAEVFLNQSGNRFSDAISVTLPEPFTDLDQISFLDPFGNGTDCLVFTKAGPEPHHYCYDFSGGSKPYLLNKVNNNLGATTVVKYRSSVSYYFDDKQSGRPWVTRLPLPVQVVEKVESIDCISGSKLVTDYKYHDGYYDAVEREFRGFGFIEQWDTQSFAQYSQHGLHGAAAFEAGEPGLHVPPLYTRTWYHTGAYVEAGVISKQFEREYYRKDNLAWRLPDSLFERAILESDAGTIRQAYRALKGQVIRQEVYGLDGVPGVSDNPYTITESNFLVRLVQPREGEEYAVFYVHQLESITYSYERNPHDPRIEHEFILEVDEYGNVRETCDVFYPRRLSSSSAISEDPANKIYSEQRELRAVLHAGSYANETQSYRRLGVLTESKTFEIHGLELPENSCFTLDAIKDKAHQALKNRVPFGEEFEPGQLQARVFEWSRDYFWNEDQTAPLLLGQITARLLLHHTEQAVFPQSLISDVFGDKVSAEMLAIAGGYVLKDDYWWNPGAVDYYYSADDSFYLAWKTEDSFGGKATLEYDQYRLTITRISHLVEETAANVVSAQVDYNVLQPKQIVDINGNISQTIYDPLGLVVATSIFGTVDGQREGDDDLSSYRRRPGATFDEVVAAPAFYLQNAATFFFYDLFAWKERQQPAASISLVRQTHVSDLVPCEESLIETRIDFTDGFGRLLEAKLKAEPGQAITRDSRGEIVRDASNHIAQEQATGRWIVSGRTVYNNKSAPMKQYLPYFTNYPYYEEQNNDALLSVLPPPTRYSYDALLRASRVNTPKGFFTKVEYTPWLEKYYDENDTVIDSDYYIEHINNANFDKDEKDALEKAAIFYNTPEEKVLDNMGRAFLAIQINVAPALGGISEFVYLPTHSTLNIQGNEVATSDPRLGRMLPPVQNLTHVFDMLGSALAANSVDAGSRLSLSNIFGNPIHDWDGRGFHVSTKYDRLQRKVETHVKGQESPATDGCGSTAGLDLDQVVECIIYGEGQPDSDGKNLRGEVFNYYDQAGLLQFPLYNIQAQAVTVRRRLLADYKHEADWSDIDDRLLDPEVFETRYEYDALGRDTLEVTPDKSECRHRYNVTGWLNKIEVIFLNKDGSTAKETFIENVAYNADGGQQSVTSGNGVVTDYRYEHSTERLVNIFSSRPAAGERRRTGASTLQNIAYTYDPAGNITRTRDHTHQTVFCDQQEVKALSNYTYDALYRLVKAKGRQHPGMERDTHIYGFKQSIYMPLCQQANPNDFTKLQKYKETYSYDDSNNLTAIRHYGPPSALSWIREIEVPADSNRAVPKESPNTKYDANGNMRCLDNLRGIGWNYRNNISSVDLIIREAGDSDSDYFVYDYSGQRVRKVVERYAFGGSVTNIDETIYVGNFVVYRSKKQTAAGTATTLERQSLRVMGDDGCVAVVNHYSQDLYGRKTAGSGERQFRYQMTDLRESSVVEVDREANVISFEEYFPYGGTAIIAGDNASEVRLKDYRYSGKERDDSTGLYYYGARYYASWLGRWMCPDPAGAVDGLNLYSFVEGNPISHVDVNGMVRCSLCKKIGHNKSNTSYHPNVKAQAPAQPKAIAPPPINPADILKKHQGHIASKNMNIQGKIIQGGEQIKVFTKPSKNWGVTVYIYTNRDKLRTKRGQSHADFMEDELEEKYREANRLIASKLETATIGSTIHEPRSSKLFATNQWFAKHKTMANIPRNPGGSVSIRGTAQALRPLYILDKHGNLLRQDVDERVSRDLGGSGSDPKSKLAKKPGQNQGFMESYANSLAGSGDQAIVAHVNRIGTNRRGIYKFKYFRATSFNQL